MCAILGILGQAIQPILAEKMVESLRHRGPDGGGVWYQNNVWLAHNRLSVIDLSQNGHQPMHSKCDRYVLTFNGEIYNFNSLKKELIGIGRKFVSESDTEVLLEACIAWGIEEAVKKFEGMFAFALYDKREKELWLCRDPMGIKPIYYALEGSKFAFSSELTPLRMLPWIDQSVDQSSLYSYFQYSYVPAATSIIKGVKKLESGALLRYKNNQVRVTKYWDLSAKVEASENEKKQLSLDDAVEQLDFILKKSIKEHMQSDVPYGAFLSGGIDSSTVVALMQSQSSKPIKTFTLGFEEASHDESVHARKIADFLGTDHHQLVMSANEIPSLIPTILGYFDEPFADNSAIPTYLVSKFARQHVTVSLSGDGGDELFGGYPRYFWANRISRIKERLGVRGVNLVSNFASHIPEKFWDNLVDPLLGYKYSGSDGLAHRVKRLLMYIQTEREQSYGNSISTWSNPNSILKTDSFSMSGPHNFHYPFLSWADEMMLIDQINYLQDDILTKVDRSSMAVSLEARVPFLIHPIVEWSWRLDSALKLSTKGDQGKVVLRKVLGKYIPENLFSRPKQGFGMPVAVWLRGPLRDWAESYLKRDLLEACGLKYEPIRLIWDEHLSGVDHQAKIWSVLSFMQWNYKFK